MSGRATTPVVEVGGDGSQCEHPVETLVFRGTDGRNGHHRCGDCGAVLGLPDVLAHITPGMDG